MSGVQRKGEKQWIQMMEPMKTRRMRAKASGWE